MSTENVKRRRSDENNNPQKRTKTNLLDYFSSTKKVLKSEKIDLSVPIQEEIIIEKIPNDPLKQKSNVFPIFLSPKQLKEIKEQKKLETLEKEMVEKESLLKNLANKDHPLLKKKDTTSTSILKISSGNTWGFGETIHIYQKPKVLEFEEISRDKSRIEVLEEVEEEIKPSEKFTWKMKKNSKEMKRREIDLMIGTKDIESLVTFLNQQFKVNLNPKKYTNLYNEIRENSNDLWVDLNKKLFCGNTNETKALEEYLKSYKQGQSFIIHGLSGTGKTQLVYMLSSKLGYDVFEINSSVERDATAIQNKFGEISQSHNVKMNKEKTVILFDDIDQGDISISSLKKITSESKQPVIFTSESLRFLKNETLPMTELSLKNNANSECILDRVTLIFTILVSKCIKLSFNEILPMVLYFNGDIRKIIMNLQFWSHDFMILERILGVDLALENKEFVNDVAKNDYLDLYFNNYENESIENVSKYLEVISELDTQNSEDLSLLKYVNLRNNHTNVGPTDLLLPSGYIVTSQISQNAINEKMDRLNRVSKKISHQFDYQIVDFLFDLCKIEEEKKLVKRRHFHYLRSVLEESDIDFINKYKVL